VDRVSPYRLLAAALSKIRLVGFYLSGKCLLSWAFAESFPEIQRWPFSVEGGQP
jgi:hypothetical protein